MLCNIIKMPRTMNYDNSEDMFLDFVEYAKSIKDKPRIKVEYVGRNGDKVNTPLEVPLTIEGFENYVWEKRGFSIHDYMYSSDDRYKAFSTVRTRVRQRVRQDQIEGGMVGQYNASITQRLNGLTEKQDIEVKGQISPFTPIDLDVQGDNGTS